MSLMLVCTMNLYILVLSVLVVKWKAARDLSRKVEDLVLRFSNLKNLQNSDKSKKYKVRTYVISGKISTSLNEYNTFFLLRNLHV
jgi:hypothetical protein